MRKRLARLIGDVTRDLRGAALGAHALRSQLDRW
jgi:hypothetical protein